MSCNSTPRLPKSLNPTFQNGTSPHCFPNSTGSLLSFHVSPPLHFKFSPLLCPDLSPSRLPKPQTSKFWKLMLVSTTKTSFSCFGDLIRQGFWLTLQTFEPRNVEMVDDLNISKSTVHVDSTF
jgi:hypothetical protein